MNAEQQFQANLTFLAQHPTHRQMYEQIHACPLTNIRLLPSPSGALYGEVYDLTTQQWSALCHPETPVEQAVQSVDQFYTPQARIFCMIGLGLGYNAVEFARRLKPYQKLCIWDVDAQLFKAMLYAVDITPLFTLPNVNLIVGSDIHTKVEEWWLSLQVQDKLHIQMPMREGYTSTYQATAYEVIMAKTVDMLRFHAVGLSTWKLFGRCIGDNDLANVPEYFLNPGYEHLDGLWQEKPAVCIAAGPSLQRNLAHLLVPEARSKVALIAVGTVYAFLQGVGLAPDVVTTIDFQRLNWTDQFQGIPLDPECPLVYLHSTYPQTVRRWPGPTFVAENCSDTVSWLRRYSEGKQSAAEVQTVAHLNLKVALALGANPIILLGQDLSMPRHLHHAAGARAQDCAPEETPPDAWVTLPDFEGKPVQTRHSFLSMLTVFERLIAAHPQTTFLNCSEAGLRIQGAEHRPLAQVLAHLPAQEAGPDTVRRAIKQRWQGYTPTINEAFAADLQRLRQHVEDLARFATEMQALEGERLALPLDLTPEQEAARLASDVESPLDLQARRQCAYDLQVIAYEAHILGERQVAWSLFAIRRFDFIELMAEIPPPSEAVATLEAQARVNAERLLRIAAMITEEYADVARLVRLAQRRLFGAEKDEAIRLLARQRYAAAQHAWQEDMPTSLPVTTTRLTAQWCAHTQQYEAALALLGTLDGTHAKQARIRRHLAQYRADLRTALPAYFQARQTITPRTAAPGTVEEPLFY